TLFLRTTLPSPSAVRCFLSCQSHAVCSLHRPVDQVSRQAAVGLRPRAWKARRRRQPSMSGISPSKSGSPPTWLYGLPTPARLDTTDYSASIPTVSQLRYALTQPAVWLVA